MEAGWKKESKTAAATATATATATRIASPSASALLLLLFLLTFPASHSFTLSPVRIMLQRRGAGRSNKQETSLIKDPSGGGSATEPPVQTLHRRRSSGHLGLLVVPPGRRLVYPLKNSLGAGGEADEIEEGETADRGEMEYFSRRTIEPGREAAKWDDYSALGGTNRASTVPFGLDDESTEECVQIPIDYTVGRAVEFIQKVASNPSREHILRTHDRIYVTKDGGILCGYIVMSDLITNAKDKPVAEIVQTAEEVMREGDFWEEASRRLRLAAISAAPVVDKNGYLIAIMSPMDLLDEMEEEATEDFLRFSGAGDAGPDGYFETPVVKLVISRVSWLVSLLMLQSLSSVILTLYQGTLEKHIMIALFLTMLTGTAGNAGNQSSAMVIRGLATGEVTRQNSGACFRKEAKAALLTAIILTAASFVRVWLTPGATLMSTVVVSFAMGATVMGAVLFGTATPLILDRIGIDPVSVASPALATITDVSGVLILCISAKVLLG